MKTQAKQPLSLLATGLSVLLLLLTALLSPAPVNAFSTPTVYSYDFEGAVGAEWSPAHTSVTPSGRGFLGEFGAETVTLTLNDLPPHLAVTLSFDFYAIRSWDGNRTFNEEGDPVGPDRFEVSVDDGPTLLDTTFANNGDLQAYPGAYPEAAYPAHSGASEVNTLGYTFFEEAVPFDAVYKLRFTFQHSGATLQVKFSGIGLQELDDEAWGLDNVVVRLAEQATVYEDDFARAPATPWAPAKYDLTPSGRRFLGQFGSEQVTLNLSKLPVHQTVTLAFDLYIIRTWDGNVDPDIFDITVNGGPTLLHTTFTNNTGVNYQPQAYPGAYPGAANPPYTGASEIGALGYLPPDVAAQDAVYQLRFTFAHNSPDLQVHFAGIGLQELADESWGLDNVIVSLDDYVAYADNFDGVVWPVARTDITPSGRGFLGQFGAETVLLMLGDLPPHTEVTLAFDFYAIETWDGNDAYWGPDIFDLRVDGGPTLLHTTFANADLPQAYPDAYPGGDNPPHSGASEINTLGYRTDEGWWGDSVYQFSFTFAHTGSTLKVSFAGIGLQDLFDESWGLDNVVVRAGQQVVYANDFETPPASPWSNGPLSGGGFLGQFGAETVTLTLDDLPTHSAITLAFDFYAIGSWDGNQEFNQFTRVGPDVFDLSIAGGPPLLHTTFSNNEFGTLPDGQEGPYLQAYPGSYPGASYFAKTGASNPYDLPTYQLSFTFPHTDSALQVNFAVSGVDDESWGLDNVRVVVRSADEPDLFLSPTSNGKVGDVRFRDEDILAYAPGQAQWRLLFDGSDVGINTDVDGFTFLDGKLLLSFNTQTDVPDIGVVQDADIVQFTPVWLGEQTAGSFTRLFDGAPAGLAEKGEDIDAFAFTADRHLVISTLSDFNVEGLKGKDEDLLAWNGAAWRLYFDGSDVGLTKGSEDIEGLWLDTGNNDIYLSTEGHYDVPELNGDNNDIFVCRPGSLGDNTSCTFRLFWNGDEHGFTKRLDGFFLGALPLSYSPPLAGELTAAGAMVETEAEDSDDLTDPDGDEADLDNSIEAARTFLPLITHE